MKKCLLLLTLIFLCGCTNIQEARPQDLIKEIVSSKNYSYNEYRTGYKYYLPLSMSCLSSSSEKLIIDKVSLNLCLFSFKFFANSKMPFIPSECKISLKASRYVSLFSL